MQDTGISLGAITGTLKCLIGGKQSNLDVTVNNLLQFLTFHLTLNIAHMFNEAILLFV